MLLSLTLGNETYRRPDVSCSIQAGVRLTPDDYGDAIGIVARDPASGVRLVRSTQIQASNVNPAHGAWTDLQYEVPAGCFVDINVTKTVIGDWLHVIMLRMRETAPLVRLGLRLTGHERSARTWAYVEGRFDIMRHPEDYEEIGIVDANPRAIHIDMDAIRSDVRAGLSSNFRYEELEPGTVPAAEVPARPDPGPVTVVRTGSRRRIVLRRDK